MVMDLIADKIFKRKTEGKVKIAEVEEEEEEEKTLIDEWLKVAAGGNGGGVASSGKRGRVGRKSGEATCKRLYIL